MASGTKRTLAELVTLHEVEPSLSEVITEGRGDAGLALWFLRRAGCETAVYSISDRLDVPYSEVKRRGQTSGIKGSLIAAAFAVEEQSSIAAGKVTFVYDVDDDVIAGRELATNACLLHTDYRSMEMYCFNEQTVDKLLKVTLRAPEEVKAEAILDAIQEPLVDIAFARLALSQAPRPAGSVESIERRCSVKGHNLIVNIRAIISDSINGAGGANKVGISIEALVRNEQELRSTCEEDVRLVIRGHDFTRICCFYLKQRYSSLFKEERAPYKAPKVFETALFTCIEFEQLSSESLFQRLLARVS